jgi:NitT/TauT family transport system substrate-binding protein
MLTRRRFLGGLALASSAGAAAWPLTLPAQEKLETTSLRLVQDPNTCLAPQYVAQALLRDEGFTEIAYVELPPTPTTRRQ